MRGSSDALLADEDRAEHVWARAPRRRAAAHHGLGWGPQLPGAQHAAKQMHKGDQAFLYHSSTAVPGIVAIMQIVKEAYPDPTAFERRHHHYDPDSDPKNPRWFMVDVQLKRRSGAHHHTGGTARARAQGIEGHGAVAPGQSFVGYAGGKCALAVHSLARMMRTVVTMRARARIAPSTLDGVLACNFDSRVYTRSPD